ncbi:MAG: rRNA pseudouridine synthase [Defluviitaleaceae bacterium]|nr:rRNA pseudouridine synthase [Defluviitaleaceae bacterium]
MEKRLQKILAEAGIASRRKAEEIIAEGRVSVNGVTVKELGTKAHVNDNIFVDGEPIKKRKSKKKYIMLHKPEGVVTTAQDQFGRQTVMDYVPAQSRLFPVGRLDYETSGLIILTNDGEWANKLLHPKYKIEKKYIATLRGEPTEEELQRFRSGVKIEGRLTAPAKISIIKREKENAVVKITITEGRNRQVRKMCEKINHPVIQLKRVAIGSIKLGDLPVGKWLELPGEIVNLFDF